MLFIHIVLSTARLVSPAHFSPHREKLSGKWPIPLSFPMPESQFHTLHNINYYIPSNITSQFFGNENEIGHSPDQFSLCGENGPGTRLLLGSLLLLCVVWMCGCYRYSLWGRGIYQVRFSASTCRLYRPFDCRELQVYKMRLKFFPLRQKIS